MDWALPGVGALGPLAHNWNDSIDPLGLQVAPQAGDNLTFYGPPGSPANFEDATIIVSVPVGGLPDGVSELEWMTPFSDDFEVVQGPNGGQLAAGGIVTLDLAPTALTTSSQGLVESVFPFFDFVYETREPIVTRAYVGIEGFTIWPDAAFDGEGGLGLDHGALRGYQPRSRWIVWQDVTVSASDDWITIDGFGGFSSPQTYAVRPVNSKAPDIELDVALDGSNEAPGTYYGSVTFSSDDSGFPTFKRTNEVVFDYCRQTSVAAPWVEETAPGSSKAQDLVVTTNPPIGATVADVDTIVEARVVPVGGPSSGASYQLELVAPNGDSVMLKDFTDPQLVYYDQDRVTPAILLDDQFEDLETGPDAWQLRFTNDPDSDNPIRVTLDRWDVRLHTREATVCAQ